MHGEDFAGSTRNEQLSYFIAALQSLDRRVTTLRALQTSPLEDGRIIPHIEVLLADRTACVVSIP